MVPSYWSEPGGSDCSDSGSTYHIVRTTILFGDTQQVYVGNAFVSCGMSPVLWPLYCWFHSNPSTCRGISRTRTTMWHKLSPLLSSSSGDPELNTVAVASEP